MKIKILNNKKQWNDFLLAQPTQATAMAGQAGVFLQSWEWGEFQQAIGRKVYRYWKDDAFAQVIELSLPFGKKYWFIPRGSLMLGISDEARKHGALFIRCEPVQSGAPTGVVKTKNINPAQTLVMDLTKSEEELLAEMHEKTRYNIRLAERKGVKCQVVGNDKFNEFWKLMQETANRDKFRTYPREYYEKMLKVLCEGAMQVRFHALYYESAMIAGAIIGYFGDTATYLHGASSYEHRALMGPYALHWEIIKDAKKQGYKYYDFWGIKTHNIEHESWSNSWAGITRFKLGFGGEVVDYPGTFDLPLNKFWYTVYRIARRLLP